MVKRDLVVETLDGIKEQVGLDLIIDIDINFKDEPEFVIYNRTALTLYWIKKYEPYISGFGWDSSFWIYVIIFVYSMSLFLSAFEFLKLNKLTYLVQKEKLV